MNQPQRVGALEIAQDLAHERREWMLERVGRIVIALIILAALLGLFGSGPLAKAQAGAEDAPLWIEYNRYERRLSPSMLLVHVTQAALKGGKLRLRLDGSYARTANVVASIPAADRQELGGDTIVYVYEAAALQGPGLIELQINPGAIGFVNATIGVDGAQPLEFSQFIYP